MKNTVWGAIALVALLAGNALPQGSVGSINGTVTDPSGAVVAGVTVQVQNRVTGFDKSATTDAAGTFRFLNLPPNNYHVAVTAGGFQPFHQDVTVRAAIPENLTIRVPLLCLNLFFVNKCNSKHTCIKL